ncbi:MAG: hypothetical protein H8E38_13250 [SAR324 cluster bacterium]|nr:hypothetical protein [SAR324 cluster bacterium]MBL7034743.1 hypothetical protein [SAR324 cluster bacterium]
MKNYYRSLIFGICLLLTVPEILFADSAASRSTDPLQVQFDLGGSIGYHLSDSLYFGALSSGYLMLGFSGMGMSPKHGGEEHQEEGEEHEGEEMYHDSGGLHDTKGNYSLKAMEMRYSPFSSSGFYLTLGYYQASGMSETIKYSAATRTIGATQYSNTDMQLKIERDSSTGPMLGLGWNWISDSGFSGGLGMVWGTTRINHKVQVTSTSSAVSEADLQAEALEAEEHMSYARMVQPRLAIGWNF